jgi:hypothetical protein
LLPATLKGVRLLLGVDAAVNTDPKVTEGVTALQEAIQIKDPAIKEEMIHLLLRAGAYTEGPKYQENYAPLHVAVRERRSKYG